MKKAPAVFIAVAATLLAIGFSSKEADDLSTQITKQLEVVEQADVEAIAATQKFRDVCPASAACLKHGFVKVTAAQEQVTCRAELDKYLDLLKEWNVSHPEATRPYYMEALPFNRKTNAPLRCAEDR